MKNAEKVGVKGMIIYSDPEDYSPSSVTYPKSWYLPEDGVQRGTVLKVRGDPLSNGYPSLGKFHFKILTFQSLTCSMLIDKV